MAEPFMPRAVTRWRVNRDALPRDCSITSSRQGVRLATASPVVRARGKVTISLDRSSGNTSPNTANGEALSLLLGTTYGDDGRVNVRLPNLAYCFALT